MKQIRHLGAYGLILNEDKIVLIKKANGPYKNKLDLPGGTIEFGETPEQTLIRELQEEVGVDVTKYTLFDANSVTIEWEHKGELQQIHHQGVFYKVESYNNEIKNHMELDENNDDSLGAEFYDINQLTRSKLSEIAIVEIEKFGYKLR